MLNVRKFAVSAVTSIALGLTGFFLSSGTSNAVADDYPWGSPIAVAADYPWGAPNAAADDYPWGAPTATTDDYPWG
jgi:hypothetical protein